MRDEVTLVTMTIGGNDEAFSRVVQNCFFFEDCVNAYFEPPTQPAGRRRVIFPGKEPLRLWATDALQLLQVNLDRVYAELRDDVTRTPASSSSATRTCSRAARRRCGRRTAGSSCAASTSRSARPCVR